MTNHETSARHERILAKVARFKALQEKYAQGLEKQSSKVRRAMQRSANKIGNAVVASVDVRNALVAISPEIAEALAEYDQCAAELVELQKALRES